MKKITLLICATTLFLNACNNKTMTKQLPKTNTIKSENISIAADSANLNCYVVYDSSFAGKRPVVLVVPEWWGLNDYTKSRATQLAQLGYLAIAVDMYGDGKMGTTPDEAGKLATPFYKNPALAKNHFDAALQKIKSYSEADTAKIAAIGYCFGGSVVLNLARLGEDLKGVVSFHGNLLGVPADKNLLKAKILVCHGADDQFVKPTEVAEFKKQMEAINADYVFKQYAGATHAFSNPGATIIGQKFKMPIAYNAQADSASWKDMKDFFARIFK